VYRTPPTDRTPPADREFTLSAPFHLAEFVFLVIGVIAIQALEPILGLLTLNGTAAAITIAVLVVGALGLYYYLWNSSIRRVRLGPSEIELEYRNGDVESVQADRLRIDIREDWVELQGDGAHKVHRKAFASHAEYQEFVAHLKAATTV